MDNSSKPYDVKLAAMTKALNGNVPCMDSTSTSAEADKCFDTVRRLAYLNQQSDGGSLNLRRGQACKTQEELEQISDRQTRETHALNCAKLNAKPYPYFNAGIMKMTTPGKYPFFSSRNNNFSNRDQTGVLCVRGVGVNTGGTAETCQPSDPNSANGVVQDDNVAIAGARPSLVSTNGRRGPCDDEANTRGGSSGMGGVSTGAANDQGASSCQQNA